MRALSSWRDELLVLEFLYMEFLFELSIGSVRSLNFRSMCIIILELLIGSINFPHFRLKFNVILSFINASRSFQNRHQYRETILG